MRVFRILLLVAAALSSSPTVTWSLPPGFADELVVGGLQEPTTCLFLPNGRILVAERHGRVRVIENGTLLSAPLLTLGVVTGYEQGLLGMALAPGFPNPAHLFVCYSYDGGAENFNRVSRFTLQGDTVVPGSEQVLIADIPTGQGWHVGGCIRFAPDGHLFISMGDAGHSNRVQLMDRLEGKLLRLRADGAVPADNPFVGTPGARPEIWQLGLRNPFRFTIQPGTGIPFVGDVGYNSWEEVDAGPPGVNFGWPLHEGVTNPPNPAYTNPLYTYDHSLGSAAITGNVFYTGQSFPAEYAGNHFFVDHVRGNFGRLVFDASNHVVSADPNWGQAPVMGWGSGPVELLVGPDGDLYYCVYNPGNVRRIRYTAALNVPPVAIATASPTAGYPPLVVGFDGAASFDANGDPLTYRWNFGDGSPFGTDPRVDHAYTKKGVFAASLTVSDGRGAGNTSPPLLVTVGNLPPALVIAAPDDGASFVLDDSVRFLGWAVDPEDGAVPASDLRWDVDLYHVTHSHPVLRDHRGHVGSFFASSHGEDPATIFYRITLSAADSTGLGDSRSVDVRPTLPPEPPHIVSLPALGGQVGVLYTYAAQASGAAPILWTLPVAPAWLRLDPGGVISGSPTQSGVHEIWLRAANPDGMDEQRWSLTVAAGNGTLQTIIPIGAMWAYFKGTSDPGAAWAQIGYPETAWLAGPSGFGYGDGDDATVLSDMQGSYSTVYTRHTFQLANAAAVTEFSLLYNYDDGFAAFLNGTRVFAQNAPPTILNTSFATASREAGPTLARQTFADPASRALLRDGPNVLAVVGLNVSLTSTDLTLRIGLEVQDALPDVPADAAPFSIGRGPAPNPFHADVVFRFESARSGVTRLEIFDVSGRLVRRILSPHVAPGAHELPWDGRDALGQRQPAGVYLYRLTAPDGVVLSRGKLARSH